jgi:uncharacterized membrane protein YphA (DoxX/SURF4 family)
MPATRWQRSITYALAALFAFFGVMKLVLYGPGPTAFEVWGYPAWFGYVVGVWELATAALLVWPRSRFIGALSGAVIMVGAAVTHLRMPELGLLPLGIPMLAACLWIAWQTRPVAATLAQ